MNQVNKQQLFDMLNGEIQRLAQQNAIRMNLAQQCQMNPQHLSILTEVAYWVLTAAINSPNCSNTTQTIIDGYQQLVRYYAGFLAAQNPHIVNDPNHRGLLQVIQNDAAAWSAAAQEANNYSIQFQQQQQQMQFQQPQMMMHQPMLGGAPGLVQGAPMIMATPGQSMVGVQQFGQINQQQIARPHNASSRNLTFGAPTERPTIGGDPSAATRKTIGGKNANPKVRRPGQPFGVPARAEKVVEAAPVEAPVVTKPAVEEATLRDWRPDLEKGIFYLQTFDQRFGYERYRRDNKNNVFQEVIIKDKNMSDQDYERHRAAFLGTRYAVKSANPDTYRKMAKTISQVRAVVDETVRQQQKYVDNADGIVDLTADELPVQVSTELTHVTHLLDAFVETRAEHIRRQGFDKQQVVLARTLMRESHFELDMVPESRRDADYELLANFYSCDSLNDLLSRLNMLSDEFKAVHMPVLERMFLDELNHQLSVAFSLRGVTMTNLFEDVAILDEVIRDKGGVAMLQKWKDFEKYMFQLIFCPPAVVSKKPVEAVAEGGDFNGDACDIPDRGTSTVGRVFRLVTVTRIAVHRNDLNLMIDANPRIGRMVGRDNAPFMVELIQNVQGNAMWGQKHLNHYVMTLDGYVVRVTMGQLANNWLISESAEQLRA